MADPVGTAAASPAPPGAARLSPQGLAGLPAEVAQPGYDRRSQRRGIVHLGLGAFHRAHQALYTDAAMAAGDRHWSITGVSLRSARVRDQLAPQDCLYTVTESGPGGDRTRLVGALGEALVASEDPARVAAAIADAGTRIVSITITEKGYLRGADGALDLAGPDLGHDLDPRSTPRTLYGLLAAGLAQRQQRGLPGLTVLCCDNLADNGRVVAGLLEQFLERRDPLLARWFRTECTCPATMVDRIVPATTQASLEGLQQRLGRRDEAAVFTEPFSQWVIEDRFAGPRPRWEAAGAQLVCEVAPYERAKLRMLNGAHSALAYVGLLRGHEYVHQAIADPVLLELVNRLMRTEAALGIEPAPGQSLESYADSLLQRFANGARPHALSQIAVDGSQKIPQRWLATLRARAGTQCEALLTALAAWIAFVRGDRFTVQDPMAAELAALWREAGGDGIAAALFGPGGRLAQHWTASPADLARVRAAMAQFTGEAGAAGVR
ncbi:MAG TPA: mannitol dehydrogenase family protein [Steroidobacteraceae bacterium]|nr:mannitol dehydrogenase family protein [Steroidobacteraceae bacterium]